MKKATDSKNMGKVNKLLPIMQEHLGKTIKAAMSRDMAAFIDFPKCSCMIGRSLLTLPMFLELVAFFITRIGSYS